MISNFNSGNKTKFCFNGLYFVFSHKEIPLSGKGKAF